jgi:hypothetical protein
VELTERFVDGLADETQVAAANKEAQFLWEYASHGGGAWAAGAEAVYNVTGPNVWESAKTAAEHAAEAAFFVSEEDKRVLAAERRAHANLLRCIFGPGLLRRVALDRSWLAWDGGAVVKLAQGIYAEGAFDRLPVLGEALEEAGCTSKPLLEHCRQPSPHVRGCWVVDLLIGKE